MEGECVRMRYASVDDQRPNIIRYAFMTSQRPDRSKCKEFIDDDLPAWKRDTHNKHTYTPTPEEIAAARGFKLPDDLLETINKVYFPVLSVKEKLNTKEC